MHIIKNRKLAVRVLSVMLIGSMISDTVPVQAYTSTGITNTVSSSDLSEGVSSTDSLKDAEASFKEMNEKTQEEVNAILEANLKALEETEGVVEVSIRGNDEISSDESSSIGDRIVGVASGSSISLYSDTGNSTFEYKGQTYTVSYDYGVYVPDPSGATELSFGFYKDGVLVITEDNFGYDSSSSAKADCDIGNLSGLNTIITTDNVRSLGNYMLTSPASKISNLRVYANSLETVSTGFLSCNTGYIEIDELCLDNLTSANSGFLSGITANCDIILPSLIQLGGGSFSSSSLKALIMDNVTVGESNVLSGSKFDSISMLNLETSNSGFCSAITCNSGINFPNLVSSGTAFLNMATINGDVYLRSLKSISNAFLYGASAGNLYLDSLSINNGLGSAFCGNPGKNSNFGDIYAPSLNSVGDSFTHMNARDITLGDNVSLDYGLSYCSFNDLTLGVNLTSSNVNKIGLSYVTSTGNIDISLKESDYVYSLFFNYSSIHNIVINCDSDSLSLKQSFIQFEADNITINGDKLQTWNSFDNSSTSTNAIDNFILNVKELRGDDTGYGSSFRCLNISNFDVSSIIRLYGISSSFNDLNCPVLDFSSLEYVDLKYCFCDSRTGINIGKLSMPELSSGTIAYSFTGSTSNNSVIGNVDISVSDSVNLTYSFSTVDINSFNLSVINDITMLGSLRFGSIDSVYIRGLNLDLNYFCSENSSIKDVEISVDKSISLSNSFMDYSLDSLSISASELTTKGLNFSNFNVNDLSITGVSSITDNFLVSSNIGNLSMPDLESIGDQAFTDSEIGVLTLPKLKSAGDLFFCRTKVGNLNMNNIESVGQQSFFYSEFDTLYLPSLKSAGDESFCNTMGNELYTPNLLTLDGHTISSSKFDKVIIPSLSNESVSLSIKGYTDEGTYKQLFLSSDTVNLSSSESDPEIILAKGETDLTSYHGYNLYSMGYGNILNESQLDTIGDNLAVLGNISSGLEIPDNVKLWVRKDSQAEQWCIDNNREYGDLDTVECDTLFDIENPVVSFLTDEINKADGSEFVIDTMGGRLFGASSYKVYLNDKEIATSEISSVSGEKSEGNEGVSVVIPSESLEGIDYGTYTLKVVFDNIVNTTYSQDVKITKRVVSIPATPLVPATPVTPDSSEEDTTPETPNTDEDKIDPEIPVIDEDLDGSDKTDDDTSNTSDNKDITFKGDDIVISPDIDYDEDFDVKLDGDSLVENKDFTVGDKDLTIKKDVFTGSITTIHEVKVEQGDDTNSYSVSVQVPSLSIRKLMGKNDTFKLKLFNTTKSKWVEWSSSDTSMATVSNGVIKTKNKTGIVKINCKVMMTNGYMYSYTVKVDIRSSIKKTSNYRNVSGRSRSFYMMLDKEIHIGTPVKINFDNLFEDAIVTYKTSDKSIAYVDKSGKIVGVKKGKCNIKVTIDQNKTKYVYYINAVVTR